MGIEGLDLNFLKNLIEIGVFLAALIGGFYAIRGDISVLRYDINHIKEQQKILNEAFTQLGKILTQVAVQDARITMIEKRVDELSHGKGYVSESK